MVERYKLEDVVGHEDIAPLRKSDPGPAFPMDSFRSRLLGRGQDSDADRYATSEPANLRSGLGPATAAPRPAGVAALIAEQTGRQDSGEVAGGLGI